MFAVDRPLKEQFDFFEDIQYFPREIHVCFTKCDLIQAENPEKFINNLENKVTKLFNKRKIKIKNFFRAYDATDEKYAVLNDIAAKYILEIATGRMYTPQNNVSPEFPPDKPEEIIKNLNEMHQTALSSIKKQNFEFSIQILTSELIQYRKVIDLIQKTNFKKNKLETYYQF